MSDAPDPLPSTAAVPATDEADAQAVGFQWANVIEPGVLLLLIGTAFGTALLLPQVTGGGLLSPPMLALLLVVNLLPAMALLILSGRRIARRRARRRGGGDARLHTRLVALFSVTAAAPILIVVVLASFLFQSGMDFWFSERSRGMFENAVSVAQNFFENEKRDVGANTLAMATDLRGSLSQNRVDSEEFYNFYVQQVVVRELSRSAIIEIGRDGVARTVAAIDPDNRAADNQITPETVRRIASGEPTVTSETSDGVEAVVSFLPERGLYLYAGRGSSLLGLESVQRARSVFADYRQLYDQSRQLQFRFVLALYFGALIVVGLVIVVAIGVADRIVRPIDELVAAARNVSQGNLEVRVKLPGGEPDEIATLGSAFNQMTERLGEQTSDLLAANDLSENRRTLIEAVLSSVASGVIAFDAAMCVTVMNAAAMRIVGGEATSPIGKSLDMISPELHRWVRASHSGEAPDPILDLTIAGEARVWAVKLVDDEDGGAVLTFEDITQQLNDQRRAAWSDVARRVAHEIKNPLTPIQLAAERLQRRFAAKQGEGEPVFRQLTATIIRQVGDLRRMVDEFSSFARMPKPLFRPDNLTEVLRQSMFLHEVAHPDVRFDHDVPDEPVTIVCDRRLLAQAFTNIFKNAVEAIGREGRSDGRIAARLSVDGGKVTVSIADNGEGLPQQRDAIVEPYVTMREGGTGLGLAIVKRIIEEHGGTLTFADAPGGGTEAIIQFDSAFLAARVDGSDTPASPRKHIGKD